MPSPIDPAVPAIVQPLLPSASPDDHQPLVVLTCGMAGSGKSTLAKAIVALHQDFTRLSVDEIIFEKHGLYGIDYPADGTLYQTYQDEAAQVYVRRFHQLLKEGQNIVLDRSFYAKEDRDKFKRMIEDGGGRWVLLHLKAEKEVLWERICERSRAKRDANSALEITRAVFEGYWEGFEVPQGEGEVFVDVAELSTTG